MQAGGEGESAAGHAAATYRGLRSRQPAHALGEINVRKTAERSHPARRVSVLFDQQQGIGKFVHVIGGSRQQRSTNLLTDGSVTGTMRYAPIPSSKLPAAGVSSSWSRT